MLSSVMFRTTRPGVQAVRRYYSQYPPAASAGVLIPDAWNPEQLDILMDRAPAARRPTEAELEQIMKQMELIYSIDSSESEVNEAIDNFIDSGNYDLMKREHFTKLEDLAEKIKEQNSHLNEDHEHEGDIREAHFHHHAFNPEKGAPKGSLWLTPSGEKTSGGAVFTGLFASWILPVIVAIGAVKFVLWKNA